MKPFGSIESAKLWASITAQGPCSSLVRFVVLANSDTDYSLPITL
jgi:hypothetical protein